MNTSPPPQIIDLSGSPDTGDTIRLIGADALDADQPDLRVGTEVIIAHPLYADRTYLITEIPAPTYAVLVPTLASHAPTIQAPMLLLQAVR